MLRIEAEHLDGPVARPLVQALLLDLATRYRGDGAEGDAEDVSEELRPQDLAPPVGAFVVARLDDRPAGCGALRRIDASAAEVKRMYVVPEARGQGVGRALLQRLEDEARTLGYRALRLECGARQPEAVALYESARWHRITPYGRYRHSPLSICFAKDLSSR